MVPFLLSKVFLHQTLCNHDYCILVYAIHQELIKSMNQKVMRNHFIMRYSLFHPKSALHISCLLFHIDEGKSVKILWLLWAFKISVLLHQRGKKTILNIALWKKLCKTGKWKQDFSMASTQHKRYASGKTYAWSPFIAQPCYTKFEFIGKTYYDTHVQNAVNSHWMPGYLGTY